MRIIDLVWDLDDTLVETYMLMVALLLEQGIDVRGEFITPQNGGKAFEEILKEASFMHRAEFAQHALYTLQRLKDIGFKHHIATHRGYNPKGRAFTSQLLGDNSQLFNSVYVLDPKRHNNKVEFLDKVFGKTPYLLFDDRPIFNKLGTVPQHVMLRTREWNQDVEHEHRFDSFDFDVLWPKIRSMAV